MWWSRVLYEGRLVRSRTKSIIGYLGTFEFGASSSVRLCNPIVPPSVSYSDDRTIKTQLDVILEFVNKKNSSSH